VYRSGAYTALRTMDIPTLRQQHKEQLEETRLLQAAIETAEWEGMPDLGNGIGVDNRQDRPIWGTS